jgi:hypothetical protein
MINLKRNLKIWHFETGMFSRNISRQGIGEQNAFKYPQAKTLDRRA